MNVQFLKDAFYRLQLDYGRPGKLLKILSESTDSITGKRTVNQEVTPIPRIVVAPISVVRKFFFDLAYMKANNNFTYGTDFDIADMIVFIAARHKVSIENELLLGQDRWQVAKVQDVAEVFFIVSLKAQQAQPMYNVIDVAPKSNLQPYGGSTND